MGIKVIWPLDYFEGTGQASGSPQPPPSQPESPPERKPPIDRIAQGRHKHLVICRQLEDCLSNLSFMGDQPSSNACRANIDSNVELGRSHNLKPFTKCTAGTSFQMQEGAWSRGVRYFYMNGKSIYKYLNIKMFKKGYWRTNLDIENLGEQSCEKSEHHKSEPEFDR